MDEPIEQIPQADWVDQDLLTKDLAGTLLDTEIAAEQARLDALPPGDPPDRAAIEHRLHAMTQLRNTLPRTNTD